MLIASSQLVFKGSADTQVFLITGKEQKSLISFSGFLKSTDQDISNLDCHEIIIYTGAQVKNIISASLERSKKNTISEFHSFRRFDLSEELKLKLVDWLFGAEDLQVMD